MSERAVILLIGIVAALAVYGVWRLWQHRRLRRLVDATTPLHLVPALDGGRPNVLYFTAEYCAQCRLRQAPILAQLANQMNVAIHGLDASEQEALARFYGIMTVPTTVVLDRDLHLVAVNHGLAPLPKLKAQLLQGSADR